MEAKEFLVSRIVDEARRRHVGLSELERKMLYFSENYPTLPDMMEVSNQFEAEYDDEKYEKKIKKLSRRAFVRDQEESPGNIPLWREAISLLKKEDHYILVMLDVPRSALDWAKLIVAGLLLTALLVAAVAASRWAMRHVYFRIPDYAGFVVIILLFAISYFLVFSNKAKTLGNYLFDLIERVIRWF